MNNHSQHHIWEKLKLSTFADEVRDLYEPIKEESLDYIGLEHIEQQTLRLLGTGRSSETQSTKKVFKKGDILFGSLRPYFKKVVQPKFSGVCSTDITVIRAKSKADQGFLLYFIGSDAFINHATNISNGTRMPRASWKVLSQSEWEIPPPPTQRKIAAILGAYDDLIENNTRRIRILEEMAQALYREWFVNFRFPGHESVLMVESELGLVPEGWEVEKLSALVGTQYGYTESASEHEIGPKFLRGMDINKTSYIQWGDVPYCPINASNHVKYRLKVGDILIIRMADPGKVGIVEKEINAVFASYLIRLQIKSPKISPYYLFYFLLSDYYQGYVTGASTGTTRKSASAGVITDIDMIIPPNGVSERFEDQVSVIRQMLNNLLDKNANLRRTRDLLLPKLISGELDVNELHIEVKS